MRRLHKINGLIILIFVLMHFTTHLSGLWGIDVYNITQALFRKIYQNPFIEPVLLTAFVVQLGVGLRLSLAGFKRKMAQKWSRIQVLSGLMILFFVAQHITGNLMARFIDGLDTTFYWPASVVNGAPFVFYFVPYYFVGVCALFVHIGCYLRLAFVRNGETQMGLVVFWGISGIGVFVALAIIAMLLGQFYPVELPPEWIGYLQKFIPSYGSPLSN